MTINSHIWLKKKKRLFDYQDSCQLIFWLIDWFSFDSTRLNDAGLKTPSYCTLVCTLIILNCKHYVEASFVLPSMPYQIYKNIKYPYRLVLQSRERLLWRREDKLDFSLSVFASGPQFRLNFLIIWYQTILNSLQIYYN